MLSALSLLRRSTKHKFSLVYPLHPTEASSKDKRWRREHSRTRRQPSSLCLSVMAVLERYVCLSTALYRILAMFLDQSLRSLVNNASASDAAISKPVSTDFCVLIDHVRQASLDWRVREEVYCYSGCGSTSTWVQHCESNIKQNPSERLIKERILVPSFSMSGTLLGKKSLVVSETGTTSTGSVVSSCLMLPRASRTRTSPTGTVSRILANGI